MTDNRSPTWWEGYWACVVGWPLYPGHTAAYIAGWEHRRGLECRL